MSRQHFSRVDRFAQMSKQEEVIAKKRQEILEKQRTAELAKQVAAAQSIASKLKTNAETPEATEEVEPSEPPPLGIPSKLKNTFCNDGSFLAHFKQILEKHKPEPPPPEPQPEPEVEGETQVPMQLESENGDITSTVGEQQLQQPPIQQQSPMQLQQPPMQLQQPPMQQQQPPMQPQQSPMQLQQPTMQLQQAPLQLQQQQQAPLQLQQQQQVPLQLQQQQQAPTTAPMPSSEPPPQSPMTQNSYFNPNIPPPIMNLQVTVPPPPPPPPPVPLQQCIPPLYMIPPPEPLQLNTIPPPKELDLNAIPKPELNLDAIQVPTEMDKDNSNDSITLPTSLETLIDMVADFGDDYEDKIRSHKNAIHPSLWFLFEKDSEQYISYREAVDTLRQHQHLEELEKHQELEEQMKMEPQPVQDEVESFKLEKPASPFDDKYDPECVMDRDEDSDDEYMRGMMDRNRDNLKRRIECRNELMEEERQREEKKKQRKSRWGEKSDEIPPEVAPICTFGNQNKPLLSVVQRTDPALLQYARQNYGTTELDEEEWKKCEEHYKVNLLYQDMLKKRQEIDRLARCGKFKYEYDSDEDVTGGTWEHKLRNAEMEATEAWASALNKQCEGKHHIGDFLPPEELKKFMEQYEAKKSNRQPDMSDYKEYKLQEDNIGFQMLQKLGWKEGQGLGSAGTGIVDPVNKAPQRDGNQGLGVTSAAAPEDCDNEYDAYRKRMMLAYRFRPNPLNNPRRAYY